MRKCNFYILLVFCMLSSCKRGTVIRELIVDNSSCNIISINPKDIDKSGRTKISLISDEVLYIPLETSEDVLVGNVKKMVVWNGYYIIWDSMSEAIFCFDAEGKLHSKIKKQGMGPEEYPRISDFTIDKKTGHVHIYWDVGQAIYEYSLKGGFIQKTAMDGIILSSIALLKKDTYLCYGEKLPNAVLFEDILPDHFRYFIKSKDSIYNYQLKYRYEDNYRRLVLSKKNFSFYNDTILLTEFYGANIYKVGLDGALTLRYNVDFMTNQYHPSFTDRLDLALMEKEKKSGRLAMLYNAFYETDRYLVFNYSWGIVGLACVDKETKKIYNLGFFLEDDYNDLSLHSSILYADNDYLYQTKEPSQLLREIKRKNRKSGTLPEFGKLSEDMNPIIVKIKLKK